ncbi:Acetyltransferase (GNAT) family protein [Glycomyces sambucus]|uniref:Acetyltransferase (GNAT) family protein n=1 Tax=Glycomyces sambucus TaxID=380244 RepID=A0A1G9CFB5_9ACTN|nr:GNAT family N-acetyltransferase [Glycomyces sambucus]SDK50340.1 Acetyltransferase (GNAT) family protein [Glycomyces sambucus]
MTGTLTIETLTSATEQEVEALARLIPQLSTSAKAIDQVAVARLIDHEATTVLLARLDGRIVGTLTLATLPLLTGFRARIEDVVVDAAARGLGVARALTDRAVAIAAEQLCRTVDLTSRPSREAANRLYEKAGFERRDSIVYRRTLEP